MIPISTGFDNHRNENFPESEEKIRQYGDEFLGAVEGKHGKKEVPLGYIMLCGIMKGFQVRNRKGCFYYLGSKLPVGLKKQSVVSIKVRGAYAAGEKVRVNLDAHKKGGGGLPVGDKFRLLPVIGDDGRAGSVACTDVYKGGIQFARIYMMIYYSNYMGTEGMGIGIIGTSVYDYTGFITYICWQQFINPFKGYPEFPDHGVQ